MVPLHWVHVDDAAKSGPASDIYAVAKNNLAVQTKSALREMPPSVIAHPTRAEVFNSVYHNCYNADFCG
jgi:hypothetical protein